MFWLKRAALQIAPQALRHGSRMDEKDRHWSSTASKELNDGLLLVTAILWTIVVEIGAKQIYGLTRFPP